MNEIHERALVFGRCESRKNEITRNDSYVYLEYHMSSCVECPNHSKNESVSHWETFIRRGNYSASREEVEVKTAQRGATPLTDVVQTGWHDHHKKRIGTSGYAELTRSSGFYQRRNSSSLNKHKRLVSILSTKSEPFRRIRVEDQIN